MREIDFDILTFFSKHAILIFKFRKIKIQCQKNNFVSTLCSCSYLSVCFDSHLSLLLRLQSSLFVEQIRKWSMESLTERLLPLIAPSKPIPPRGFDLDGLSIPVPNWIPCHSHDIRLGDLPHKYVTLFDRKKSPFFDDLHLIFIPYFQLIYSLNTGRDYGTILCWAENKLGTQLEPCVFHLIPAGKQYFKYFIDDFQPMYLYHHPLFVNSDEFWTLIHWHPSLTI